jgi:hypothetical protein
MAVSLQPPPHAVAEATVDPFEAVPRWRFQGRDLLALGAIAVAVWFAIRGVEGLPFHQSGSLAPAEAADQIAASITIDRHELGSIPRAAAAAALAGQASTGGTGQDKTGSGSGTKGHPKPPPGEADSPLLQATVPGVGTITVDDPDLPLPDDPADLPLPPLLQTVPVTVGTPTLPLP